MVTDVSFFKKTIVICGLGLLGWAVCGASMGIGMALTDINTALLIHAIVAPAAFGSISFFYHRRLAYTSPPVTALIFIAIVVVLDVFLVAMVIEKSFAMFRSFGGTWGPFILIISSTWLVGRLATKRQSG